MPPRRVAPQPNEFERVLEEYNAFVAEPVVDHDSILDLTDTLEETGLRLVGDKVLPLPQFAEAMHKAFVQFSDVEIVPPLSTSEVKLVAGKVATYAGMTEAAAPKRRGRPRKTDTTQIPTSNAKP